MNAELRLDAERRTAHRDGVSVPLSPREFDLLRFLLDNPGRDLSVETVFERAWALPYRGDSRTLRVHVRSVRRKLASLGRPGIRIASVSGVGYRADPW
jgi:two-component system alkaline phosphatase synthesis response regulator PhoP